MTAAAPTAPLTIAHELEVRRLEHRAARLRRAIVALEDRRLYRERSEGAVPAPLQAALRGFREELERVEHRLGALRAA